MNEIYFGNKNKFAIRYVPVYKNKDSNHFYAYLHLVLGGQIIGDIEESCYLTTWLISIKKIRDRVNLQFENFKNKEFINRSDDEIFELIWKANQMEGDYNHKYLYLPVLDNSIWNYCHVAIDETIDAWLITMTENKGNLKFIWQGWREPCPKEKIGKLYSIDVDRVFFIETITECIKQVEMEFNKYPMIE